MLSHPWSAGVARLKALLGEARRCLIVSHVNPDGDAVGSSLAAWGYLRAAFPAMEVLVAFPNRFPDFLSWIEGADRAVSYLDSREAVHTYLQGCDLLLCLDFNDLARLEALGEALTACAAPRVLIDHHLRRGEEFDLVLSDPSASSTSELLYRVIVALEGKPLLSKGIAEALYTGLMTDTGSFSFSVNTPDTFRMAADLMELGIDKNEVAARVYDSYSESRMRLLGYCLQSQMRLLPERGAAYISLSREEMDSFNFQPGDTEGFVNYPLSIRGITLSALLTEATDKTHIRVSLRSKGKDISVNDMARKHFNGGGHFNAAGGKYFDTMENCKAYLEKIWNESC
ncbi:MAG: bifunctional oligoribonuclease/PAP phosphatase NrnA [Prevotellaceae bacterium]|jgi:phosphoesterase RecJ-like protein|nr:bifunctional oligoribonuclease/PAP phosphatase NrnA [Prevotellaceae bacterium]